jgi:hypothetical protein
MFSKSQDHQRASQAFTRHDHSFEQRESESQNDKAAQSRLTNGKIGLEEFKMSFFGIAVGSG